MSTSRFVVVALSALLALPAVAQQVVEKTAGETVVIPGLPGPGGNKEMRIAGQEISISQMTGPELSVTAQVIQWEEGRSITVRLPNGETRVVPVPSNIIFPPDLRLGGNVTFLVRQTEDGRFRVTGLTTGMTSAPPYFGSQPPQQPEQPPPPPAEPPQAVPAPGTVSAPPATTQPGPPPPRGKAVVGASYLTVTGTVKAFERGVSITITEKSGRERVLAIADGAAVFEGLAVGAAVTARVPLQRPFDGKTTDKIEKPKPKKAPPQSNFGAAQVPKS
jgi:hypothetical protein